MPINSSRVINGSCRHDETLGFRVAVLLRQAWPRRQCLGPAGEDARVSISPLCRGGRSSGRERGGRCGSWAGAGRTPAPGGCRQAGRSRRDGGGHQDGGYLMRRWEMPPHLCGWKKRGRSSAAPVQSAPTTLRSELRRATAPPRRP